MSRTETNREGWRGINAGKLKGTQSHHLGKLNIETTNSSCFTANPGGAIFRSGHAHVNNIIICWVLPAPEEYPAYPRKLNYLIDKKIVRYCSNASIAVSFRCVNN